MSTAVSALALALVLGVAGTLFGRRALLLTRLVRLGKPVQRFDDSPSACATRRSSCSARRSCSSASAPA